jgi:hypothetical protein
MADGEPVSQRQFFEKIDESNGKVLKAIGKVDDKVQANSVTLGKVETKLNANEKRMDAQDTKINDQKKWNRGLAAVEGLLVTALAALGIRGD